MTNSYRIDGDVVIILANRRFDKRTYEVLVDVDDFHLVDQIQGPWTVNRDRDRFYVRGHLGGSNIQMHRLIAGTAGSLVDHKEGTTLDNRRRNLRSVGRSLNNLNRHTAPKTASGYRGVYRNWRASRFFASLRGKYIGSFDTAAEAATAYLEALASIDPISARSYIEAHGLPALAKRAA